MKKEDKETRYYLDIDLKSNRIIGWDFDQRDKLVSEKMDKPYEHRIFLTKGQYNKLNRKKEEYFNSRK